MPPFRSTCPSRRNIKSVVAKHGAHRIDLRLDFNQRCGYCNDWDYYKTTYYEIDHFVPEHVMINMSNTDYANLVYACRSCNNSKRAKWPSGDEKIAIINDTGFMDPCDIDYSTQFKRNDDGDILGETKLGKWMYVALNLSKPQHQIIYQLELLDNLIDQIEQLGDEDLQLQAILNQLLKKYRRYTRELKEI